MKKISSLALALCLAGYASAHAAVLTEYTSLASYNAATTTSTTIDFEGMSAFGTYTEYDPGFGGSKTIQGLTFSSPYQYANNQSTPFGPNANDLSTDYFSNGGFDLTLTTPAGVSAFGSNLISGLGSDAVASFSVYLAGNTSGVADFTLSPTVLAINTQLPRTFYGFTITGGTIGHILVKASNGTSISPAFDNVQYGTVNSVPEPSTYALLVSGASALFVFARRRQTS